MGWVVSPVVFHMRGRLAGQLELKQIQVRVFLHSVALVAGRGYSRCYPWVSQYVLCWTHLDGTAGPRVDMSGELREWLRASGFLRWQAGQGAWILLLCYQGKQWCLQSLLLQRAFQLIPYHLAESYFLYILVALLKHDFFSCAPGWPHLLPVSQYHPSPLQFVVLGSVPIVTMSLSLLPFPVWFLYVVQKLFSQFSILQEQSLYMQVQFGVSAEKASSGSFYIALLDPSFLTHLFLKPTENHLQTNAL